MKITVSDLLEKGLATNNNDFFDDTETFDTYEDTDSGTFIAYYDVSDNDYYRNV